MLSFFDRFKQALGKAAMFGAALASLALVTDADAQRGKLNQFGTQKFVPGRAWVVLKPSMTEAQLKDIAAGFGCDIERMLFRGQYLLKVRPAQGLAIASDAATLDVTQKLKGSGQFVWAGVDKRLYYLDVPNDARYSEQWHHPLIKNPAAWSRTKGSATGVNICILDSGFDVSHPDLSPRLTSVQNFDGGAANDVTDNVGHGTHVAGCAAAATNNSIGVAGVDWNSKLHGFKIGDSPSYSAAAAALQHILTNIHIAGQKTVVNMSFGNNDTSDTPDLSDPFAQSILGAANAGVVICIAAGNSFQGGNPPAFPANVASAHVNVL